MRIGTTFSHRHASYIGLSPNESLIQTLDLDFDVLRLCSYWNEIQPTKNGAYFDAIFSLLEECEKKQQDVAMTVGMKAPRWPEFYIPQWAQGAETGKYVLEYIEKLVLKLKDYTCIKYWQVENEPLDPSGPNNQIIEKEIIKKEIELISTLDPTRPIILTAWGNQLTKRNHIPTISPLADIVGLDMYYKVPHKRLFKKSYNGPSDSMESIKQCVKNCKELWIMELQAEPWEDFNIYNSEIKTPSFNHKDLITNFTEALKLHPRAIFFWGVEYWLWQAKKGNMSYIEEYMKVRNTL